MRFLLDTCAVSELANPRPNPGVIAWMGDHDESCLYLSVVTLGEIQKGISQLANRDRQASLNEWLHGAVVERFSDRLLLLDADIMRHWGHVLGEQARRGITLPVVDMLVAATAQVHDMTVVTRHVADMERCGAPVANPWR